MNGSQLLYQIQDLQYRIRMKEAEQKTALKDGDEKSIEFHVSALEFMKQELAIKVKAFNSLPPAEVHSGHKTVSKIKWWERIFKNFSIMKK